MRFQLPVSITRLLGISVKMFLCVCICLLSLINLPVSYIVSMAMAHFAVCSATQHSTQVHVFLSIGTISLYPPLFMNVTANSRQLRMEVDTGAGATVMSLKSFKMLFPSLTLQPSNVVLHSVNGQISNVGETQLNVCVDKKLY